MKKNFTSNEKTNGLTCSQSLTDEMSPKPHLHLGLKDIH